MADLPAHATRDEIIEELDFLHVLIESLDSGSDDYAAKLEGIERSKSGLIDRLRNMQSSSSRVQHDLGLHEADQQQARPSWPTTTPNGSGGPVTDGDEQLGSSRNNTGSKRPFSGAHLSASYERSSKRPTPDPGTPSSSDSFQLIECPSAELSEKVRRRQLEAESACKRRRERQLADEQFARSLENLGRPSSSFASSSGQNVQTTIGRSGSFQRPPPPAKPEPLFKPEMSHQTALPYTQYANQPSPFYQMTQQTSNVKPEPGQLIREPAQRARQIAVVDLTASDSESEQPRSSTRPVHVGPPQTQTPLRSHRNLANPHAGLPAMRTYSPANHGGYRPVYGNAGQMSSQSNGFMTAAQSAFNSVKNLAYGMSGQLSELNGLINGHNAHHHYDVDDDDVIFNGMRGLSRGQPSRTPRRYPGYEDADLIYSGTRGAYAGQEELFRDRYNAFANYDPAKTKEEINSLLENIRPDEELPDHLRVQTPLALTIRLHKYQELGLTWLQKCEDGSNKGGILADDMGLGKTIQMISLIVTRKSEDPNCRTTLVVAPVALMRQWKQEIEQKVKPGGHRLNVFTHHSQSKKKRFSDFQHYDVVLTTYGSIAAEVKRLEKFHLRQKHDSDARPRNNERCVLIGDEAHWYRVILDEAQCIKNKATQTAKGVYHLRAIYRFCMTGTPMMNSVDELYSLIHFLRIKPYATWEKFRLDFTTPLKDMHQPTKDRAMQRLQTLCKAIMLRRTKQSKYEGQPILVLPERTTEIDNPEFSSDESMFYQALEQRTQLQFNKYLRTGTVGTSYSAILVLLLRLRQACCHPHLIRDFGVSAAADVTPEELVNLAEELSDQVVARIKDKGGNFDCPVCYDASTNPAIFIPCGHDTCSDCFAKITDPANAIADGNEGRGPQAKCPTCRAPVDPKRITDWESFKRVHQRDLLTEEELAALDPAESATASADEDSDDDADDESDTESDSPSETDSLKDFIVKDDEDEELVKSDPEQADEPQAGPSSNALIKSEGKGKGRASDVENADEVDLPFRALVKAEDNGEGKAEEAPEETREKEKSKKKSKKAKGKEKKKKKKKPKSTKTLADLKKEANRNAASRKKYLRMLQKDWVSSAKIDKTLDILKEIMSAEEGEKVLIFSQWTSLLDLLEVPVDREGWGYRRYDGSMKARARGDAVDDFRDTTKNVRIMLVSLKAGNAGLNLNMASRVIILDPFWNPYIEEQAIDRAHRIGQSRPVKVHRILVENTVEDRIIELQEKKRELISQALDEKAGQNIARLGVQELAYLFGVTGNPSQQVNYQPRGGRR